MSSIECCYGKLPGPPVTPLSALEIPRDSKIVEDSVPSPYTYATKSSPRKIKNYFILSFRALSAAPKFSAIHAKQFPAPADTPSPRFLMFVSRGFPSSFHFEVLQKSSGFSHGPPRTFHSWSPESVIYSVSLMVPLERVLIVPRKRVSHGSPKSFLSCPP